MVFHVESGTYQQPYPAQGYNRPRPTPAIAPAPEIPAIMPAPLISEMSTLLKLLADQVERQNQRDLDLIKQREQDKIDQVKRDLEIQRQRENDKEAQRKRDLDLKHQQQMMFEDQERRNVNYFLEIIRNLQIQNEKGKFSAQPETALRPNQQSCYQGKKFNSSYQ